MGNTATDVVDRSAPDAGRRTYVEVTELSDPRTEALAPGTRVEVRNRFDDAWSGGFEVLAPDDDGYRIRRLSDGSELPITIAADDVRPERRRRRNMWWY